MSEPLIRRINREQMCWRAVDVEQLIEQDHVARTIWDLVGGLDLEGFCAGIGCSEEAGGRPAFDPQLLIQLVDLRLQPRHRVGEGGGAALRVGAGVAMSNGPARRLNFRLLPPSPPISQRSKGRGFRLFSKQKSRLPKL
jgi:hypothetical protein